MLQKRIPGIEKPQIARGPTVPLHLRVIFTASRIFIVCVACNARRRHCQGPLISLELYSFVWVAQRILLSAYVVLAGMIPILMCAYASQELDADTTKGTGCTSMGINGVRQFSLFGAMPDAIKAPHHRSPKFLKLGPRARNSHTLRLNYSTYLEIWTV